MRQIHYEIRIGHVGWAELSPRLVRPWWVYLIEFLSVGKIIPLLQNIENSNTGFKADLEWW